MAKKAAAPKKQQRTMSDEHKAALAEGREQGRLVRRYLEALESHRRKRGRRRTPESIAKRLAAIDEQVPAADPLTRLHLAQERMDLEQELGTAGGNEEELEELEAASSSWQPPTRAKGSDLRSLAVDRYGTPSAEGRRDRAGSSQNSC